MRANTVLGLLVAFLSTLAVAIETDRTVDIFVWPLSAPKPQSLAKITYNSTAATIQSYADPKISTDDEIVRIGFYHPSGSWSGIATAASNLAPEKHKKLQLHVKGNGELYHLGFSGSNAGTSSKTSNKQDGLSAEVVKVKPGPLPHLNKPVVLSADGKVEEKEPEKNFFQKYWWVIAGFLLLQMVIGGGGKQE